MWPDWYVEYIEVYCNNSKYFFPVYEWVIDGFTTAEGKAVLPRFKSAISLLTIQILFSDHEQRILRIFREEYLKQQRKTYRLALVQA